MRLPLGHQAVPLACRYPAWGSDAEDETKDVMAKVRVSGCMAVMAAAVMLLLAGCTSSGVALTSTTGSPSPRASRPPRVSVSFTAARLLLAMKALGLPISKPTVYTAATDPSGLLGQAGGYSSKVAWIDRRAVGAMARHDGITIAAEERLTPPGSLVTGGVIEVYPTVSQAEACRLYLSRYVGTPVGDGYDEAVGMALLRLSPYLSGAQAKAYEHDFTACAKRLS